MIIIFIFSAFAFVKVSANLGADNGQLPSKTDVIVSSVISNEKPTFLFTGQKNSEGIETVTTTVMSADENCFVFKDVSWSYWIVDLQGKFKVDYVSITNILQRRQVNFVIELLSVCENATHVCEKVSEIKKEQNISCNNQEAEKVRIKSVNAVMPMKICIIEVYGVAVQEITTTRPTTTRMPTTPTTLMSTISTTLMNVQPNPLVMENVINSNFAKNSLCRKEESETVVDLAGTFLIDNVVLRSSPNCKLENNPSAAVELYSVCGSWSHVCGKLGDPKVVTADEPRAIYNISCERKMGTKVRVSLSKEQNMKICDIDVYGEKIK